MNALDMERHLQTTGLSVQVHDTVDSTNTLAKRLAENGAPEGTVVIASHQTAGKGTRGRSFYSPDQTGLYMSIVLRPELRVDEALFITTTAAVAVCRAVERVSQKQPFIKWVNDIYCDGKKVCGILTESALKTGTALLDYAVLGIGVNVSPPKAGFPTELADIAGTVFDDEGDVAALAASILDEFFDEYARLSQRRLIGEYRQRSLLIGRAVTISTSSGERKATALDIDDDCRLVVRYENGDEQALSSGDVSVRSIR